MGLKYKNFDLELPELGERLVIKFESEDKIIGYFYLDENNQKRVNSIHVINYCDSLFVKSTNKYKQWSCLPEFKKIDIISPPIGKKIVLASSGENGLLDSFRNAVFLKGQKKLFGTNEFDEKIEYTHWIEFEAFDEEK